MKPIRPNKKAIVNNQNNILLRLKFEIARYPVIISEVTKPILILIFNDIPPICIDKPCLLIISLNCSIFLQL